MVPCLLEEIEEVLAGDKLEEQQEIGRGFERAVERDEVRMGRERLMDACLFQSGCKDEVG